MRAFRIVLDNLHGKEVGIGVLSLGAVGLTLLASWGAPRVRPEVATHPRARLFPADSAGRISDVLEPSARLSVLFHPELGGCAAEQLQTIEALDRLSRDFEDIAIFSVLPQNLEFGTVSGHRLPGEIVRTTRHAWVAASELSPRPRLEVWSADGRLLVLRSLPRTVSEEEIYEEVLWARSFTEPADSSRSR